MQYPATIKNLISCFKKLPGVGEKSAERLALATLNLDQSLIDLFSVSLKNTKTKIIRCTRCHNLTEDSLCEVCKDDNRDKEIICVVEEPKNVIMFEKIGTFNGIYHVLDGLISPLDGILPENINIKTLLDRVKTEKVKEIILAIKPSIEGETTALYISKMLKDKDIIISKIAHGVPQGADMEYIDSLTLEMALEERKKI